MSAVALKPVDVRLMNFMALALAGISVAVFCVFSVRWVLTLPLFGITRIVIDGDTAHHNAITLQANIAGRLRGNFFDADLIQMRKTFESIPWVRRAIVRREFPGRLRVTLEEHRSVGFWGNESESRLINSYGEVFDANIGEAETEALPRLIAADSQASYVLDMFRDLSTLLSRQGVSVSQLELTGSNAWQMQLDTGTRIEMGRGQVDQVLRRFEHFLMTYEHVLATYGRADLSRVESVDLRNGSGYAIRIQGVTTAVPGESEKK